MDVDTGKESLVLPLPPDKSPLAFTSVAAEVTSDGMRAIVYGSFGVKLINLRTGQLTPTKISSVPASFGVAITPDGERIALSEMNAVVLVNLWNPDDRRIVGNPAAQMVSADPRKLLTGVVSESSPKEMNRLEKEKRKRLGTFTRPKERQEIEDEYDKRVSKRLADPDRVPEPVVGLIDAYVKDTQKFGGRSMFPPASAFLGEGRFLAVRSADLWWNVWDVASGNRLPFRKEGGDVREYAGEERWLAALLDPEIVREIERTLTGKSGPGEPGKNGRITVVRPRRDEQENDSEDEDLGRAARNRKSSSNTMKFESRDIIGFTPDGRQCLTATTHADHEFSFGIWVWDMASVQQTHGAPVRPLFELPDARASSALLTLNPKGNVLMGPDRENGLSFWDRNTGELLGTLRALQEGEWLVTTPTGLFDGSPRAWETIAWRDSPKDLATRPTEIFFNEFYRPGLLADLIAGRKPNVPRNIAQVDRRQPKITINTGSSNTPLRTVPVHIEVEEATTPLPGGVRDLRLFRNGSLVKVWRGDLNLAQGRAAFDFVVPLISGENRLAAYAFNHDNIKSQDASTIVQCTAPRRLGTAYVIAVGINRYANPEFNLKFAIPDAQRLSEMLAQTQQQLGTYSHFVAVRLHDDQATRANILLALSILGGRQKGALPQGAPQDSKNCYPLDQKIPC